MGKSFESTKLQLIGFFVPKKPINYKFVDISPSVVDMNDRYFETTVYSNFGEGWSTNLRWKKPIYFKIIESLSSPQKLLCLFRPLINFRVFNIRLLRKDMKKNHHFENVGYKHSFQCEEGNTT